MSDPINPVTQFATYDGMTQPKRDSWLRGTIRSLGAKITLKFRLGRIEHGGDIGDQTVDYLLNQMEEEAIDQLMYVRELKRRIIDTKPIQSGFDIVEGMEVIKINPKSK